MLGLLAGGVFKAASSWFGAAFAPGLRHITIPVLAFLAGYIFCYVGEIQRRAELIAAGITAQLSETLETERKRAEAAEKTLVAAREREAELIKRAGDLDKQVSDYATKLAQTTEALAKEGKCLPDTLTPADIEWLRKLRGKTNSPNKRTGKSKASENKASGAVLILALSLRGVRGDGRGAPLGIVAQSRGGAQ